MVAVMVMMTIVGDDGGSDGDDQMTIVGGDHDW
jgi:hypothetical protein